MSKSLEITLALVNAQAIREAAMSVSEDEDMHQGEEVGEACIGCRWRMALYRYAENLETNARDTGGPQHDRLRFNRQQRRQAHAG